MRATQSLVEMSGPARAHAGPPDRRLWVSARCPAGGANDAGSADHAGDKGTHVEGRSRGIHMLRNGFLVAGAGVDDATDTGPAAAGCDHTAGSGSSAAANLGRSEHPAMTATNTLSAATTAVAGCHRRSLPAR
jgi:hypothetical protein